VVQEVFRDAYNYMKSGQLLRQVVNKINGVDFNNLSERKHFWKLIPRARAYSSPAFIALMGLCHLVVGSSLIAWSQHRIPLLFEAPYVRR
jgi:hypothetical protein